MMYGAAAINPVLALTALSAGLVIYGLYEIAISETVQKNIYKEATKEQSAKDAEEVGIL